MSMLDYFFSNKNEGRADLFDGLDVFKDEKYRELQGSYPVISMTFAGVKGDNYEDSVKMIKKQILGIYGDYGFLREFADFREEQRESLKKIHEDMDDVDACLSLNLLSRLLMEYYGKKVLIFLDEYDTPLQEAYIGGYWDRMASFIRNLFNNTFKTNPYLDRAVMTGITRVSKESIFSDLNNLTVVTTSSDKYATSFGFTEKEVFNAMDAQGMAEEEKQKVKYWYDGFIFGKVRDIYNPWSVTVFLDSGKYGTHWANTSSNSLVGKLIREGKPELKMDFEALLKGGRLEAAIDEQIVYSQLGTEENAIWSLLLASGYLKSEEIVYDEADGNPLYNVLTLTNHEVGIMFSKMVKGWFLGGKELSRFVSAMLRGDEEEMNLYMNELALSTFSYFDPGKEADFPKKPENFYHGFVLGLLVDQAKEYRLKSNRKSGYGRYDVVMEPYDSKKNAAIMEFKVFNEKRGEKTLEDTAMNALMQIDEKKYDADLLARSIPAENIYKYGFAFKGKECLIKRGDLPRN